MHIIVGLGNPGKEYEATRHNIGFIFLDYLAERNSLSFKGSKWQADVVKDRLWGESLLLVKPLAFMNRSGQSVGKIAKFYNVEPENIIVVHDDLDLPLGRIKVTINRGAGGHNGIRSIMDHLGSKGFPRVKVGIGRPERSEVVSKFVLSRFASEEKDLLGEQLQKIEEAVELIITSGPLKAMNQINSEK